MSFWKNLAQLAVRKFDAAECTECPKGPPGADPAFATAVTALGGTAVASILTADVPSTKITILNAYVAEGEYLVLAYGEEGSGWQSGEQLRYQLDYVVGKSADNA